MIRADFDKFLEGWCII